MTIRMRRLLAVFVSLGLSALAGCSQRGSTETLWIGHVAPLSGPDKVTGEHAGQGVRLAVVEADAEPNLVLGRKIAVRHADARGDGRDAEAEAVRLKSVNRVEAMLGGTDAVQAEHLARGAESAAVPVVLQAAFPATTLNENAFCITPSLSRRGQVLGWFVARDFLKATHIAMLVDETNRAAVTIADAFGNAAPKDRLSRFGFKKVDEFAELLARAAKSKPQGLVFAGSVRDVAKLRGEQQKAGLTVPLIFAGEDGALPALLGDRDAGEDVYLLTSYLPSDAAPRNAEFVKKYQEQFHEPPDVNAALAYDGARILLEALRAANSTNAAKVREALAGIQGFESVTGPLTFGDNHFARRPLFVVQIKQGQATMIRRNGADE